MSHLRGSAKRLLTVWNPISPIQKTPDEERKKTWKELTCSLQVIYENDSSTFKQTLFGIKQILTYNKI